MLRAKIALMIFLLISILSHGQKMKKEFLNKTPGYTNVVSVNNGDITTLYIAGQVGSGNTMEEQIRSSYVALINQLKIADAKFSDVVKITIYIVDYKEEYLPLFKKIRIDLFGNQIMPAITMVGISSLALESMTVEMDAVAIFKNK